MASNLAANYNGDDDEEEALRKAIALSLGQDPSSSASRQDAIDLTADGNSDSEESEIVERIEKHPPKTPTPIVVPSPSPQPSVPEPPKPTPSSFSALGIDRKRMEEERLARINKRKAAELGPAAEESSSRPSQRQKTTESAKTSAVPMSLPMPITTPSKQNQVVGSFKPLAVQVKSFPALPLAYPGGVVKRTWVRGQPRQADDITIEEVLQQDKLQIAVLSSFQWDDEWLLKKIDVTRTKMLLIAFATDEYHQEQMRANAPSKNIRFTFPPMNGLGSMHSKLQILKYENYIRIAVPTGNLVSYDWGETGTQENMVFLIDLPKFETAAECEAQKLTPFAESLIYFLEAQELDNNLVKSLRKYDFSKTRRYAFVHSIAGTHVGDSWRKTGYCGLGRAVSELKLASDNPIDLDVVCASLGAVKYDLLRTIYFACQGDSGLKEYEPRTRKGKKTASAGDMSVEELNRHIRVYFPSQKTVMNSRGGKASAGTICFQRHWWEASTFPQKVLYDCQSTRTGILIHSKAIFVTREAGGSATPIPCFAYVGSANFSESAWGKLTKDQGGNPKMTCRNWECGVLAVPTPNTSESVSWGGSEGTSFGVPGGNLTIFKGCVPVPMQVPSSPLGDGVMRPWFYKDG